MTERKVQPEQPEVTANDAAMITSVIIAACTAYVGAKTGLEIPSSPEETHPFREVATVVLGAVSLGSVFNAIRLGRKSLAEAPEAS